MITPITSDFKLLIPVSYTHLDVYKRQALAFSSSIFFYTILFAKYVFSLHILASQVRTGLL